MKISGLIIVMEMNSKQQMNKKKTKFLSLG